MMIDKQRSRQEIYSEVLYHDEWCPCSTFLDTNGEVKETARLHRLFAGMKKSRTLYRADVEVPHGSILLFSDKVWFRAGVQHSSQCNGQNTILSGKSGKLVVSFCKKTPNQTCISLPVCFLRENP